jgi:uncharacterized protein (DUF3084 family)
MESRTNQSKKNQRWIIILAVSVVITIGVIYWQNQSLKEDQMGIATLESNIEQLKQEMNTIKNKKREVEINRDSLQKNLNYLWQYKTLVQSTKVRDQVGDNFNFQPGDRVRLKADSSVVVITDLMVGGNRYNYFVKFLIKNNKGLQSEVSPVELEQIK